jgi:hypothetical protein
VEADVTDHPRRDDQLQRFEVVAVFAQLLGIELLLPECSPVLAVVDQKVGVPDHAQRSAPNSTQEQVRRELIIEARAGRYEAQRQEGD